MQLNQFYFIPWAHTVGTYIDLHTYIHTYIHMVSSGSDVYTIMSKNYRKRKAGFIRDQARKTKITTTEVKTFFTVVLYGEEREEQVTLEFIVFA